MEFGTGVLVRPSHPVFLKKKFKKTQTRVCESVAVLSQAVPRAAPRNRGEKPPGRTGRVKKLRERVFVGAVKL